jgi:integrase
MTMPGRPKLEIDHHPLAPYVSFFASHLRKQGHTDSTIRNYLYITRAHLSELPDEITIEGLREYVDRVRPKYRRLYRTGWRAFVAFLASQGMSPEAPEFPASYTDEEPRGRPPVRSAPIDRLMAAFVERGARPQDLTALSWRDLRNVGGGNFQFVGGNDHVRVPRALLEDVRAINWPDHVEPPLDYFVFPNVPESLRGVSVERVEAGLLRFKRDCGRGITTPWKERAPVFGAENDPKPAAPSARKLAPGMTFEEFSEKDDEG